MSVTVGQVIKEYRNRAGISQAELGELIGKYPDTDPVDFTAISRWENGGRVPRVGFAIKIAESLGINPLYFLGLVVNEGHWSSLPIEDTIEEEIYKFFEQEMQNEPQTGNGEEGPTDEA